MYFYRHHQTYKSRVTKTCSQIEIWKTTMLSKVVSGMFRSRSGNINPRLPSLSCFLFQVVSDWVNWAWFTQFTIRVPAWTAWSPWSPSQEWCDLRSADADQRRRLGRPWDRPGKILVAQLSWPYLGVYPIFKRIRMFGVSKISMAMRCWRFFCG